MVRRWSTLADLLLRGGMGVDPLRLRAVPLLVIGVGAQVTLGLSSTPVGLLVPSMGLLGGFLWMNRSRPGLYLVFAGLVLNICVIAANGSMPVSAHSIEKVSPSGMDPADLRHRAADGDTVLSFLGDLIPLGKRVYSLGDLLMATGLLWFLVATALALASRPRFVKL